MQWLYSNALGGIRLQVPESYVCAAKECLECDDCSELFDEKESEEFLCQSCEHKDTKWQVSGKRVNFLMMAILQFPIWPVKKIIRCFVCGEQRAYKSGKPNDALIAKS